MNRLDLTKQQERRLLKMAVVLFPQYDGFRVSPTTGILDFWEKEWTYLKTDGWGGKKKQFIDPVTKKPIRTHKCYDMHWFEFCIRILGEEMGLYSYKNTFISTHPVDYLYFHFKKLKL